MGILLVEDDLGTAEICKTALGHVSQIWTASTLQQAKVCLENHEVELIVLDIQLPDGNGVDFYNSVVSQSAKPIPVIFLTSKDEVYSKVTAFSIGALDYISKPFNTLEFQARVKSHYQRIKSPSRVLDWGIYRADPDAMRAYVLTSDSYQLVECTAIEFKVFVALLNTPQKIFSREELIDRVWGHGTHISERNIDSHIARLRKKLSHYGGGVDSIRGAGYRITEVKRKSSGAA